MAHSNLKYIKALVLYFLFSVGIYLVSLSTLQKIFASQGSSLLLNLYLSAICYFLCYKFRYTPMELGFTPVGWKRDVIEAAIVSVIFVFVALWGKSEIDSLCNQCITKVLTGGTDGSKFFDPEARENIKTVDIIIADALRYIITVVAQEYIRAFMRVSMKNIYTQSRLIPVLGSAMALTMFHMHLSFLVTMMVLIPQVIWSFMQSRQKSIIGSIFSHWLIGILMIYFLGRG